MTRKPGTGSAKEEDLANQHTAGQQDLALAEFPDGIAPRHLAGSSGFLRGFVPIAALGSLLLAALLGVFGGTSDPQVRAAGNGVDLTVTAPGTLRSGMILEVDIAISTTRPIAKPVIVISGTYLHNLSFNSIIPDASQAAFDDGQVTLQYDALQPGQRLQVKLDGQVNPSLVGENQGVVQVRDYKMVLVERPVSLRVFP